jgi:hypothetical protein
VVVTAGFVIWAVASSGSGGGRPTTVRIGGGVPPPTSSPIAVRLANAVGRANLGRRFRSIDMTGVAPFAWDRMYVFRDETRADIQRRLGFDWPGAPSAVPRGGEPESLIAFVRGRAVVGSAFFSDAIGHLDCLTAPGGYARGTRFVVRFTRRTRDAYLATTAPDLAEAACLAAVGAITH